MGTHGWRLSAWRWATGAAVAVALAAGGRAALADSPTVEEMDKYVAQMAAQDLQILKNTQFRQLWTAPHGKPTNTGAKNSPLDLRTAYTSPGRVTPGTVVWITAGTYDLGNLKPSDICGTREKPIIFRAVPGARATLNAQVWSKRGCNHIWWWGVEVTGPVGSGVQTREGGDGIKFINLFLHDKHSVQSPATRMPSAMGIGGWDTGNDHEFYGNIVFRNGWNTLDHGFYSQNTGAHTTKRYVDNLVFENTGLGFQIYGSGPVLRNIYFEGNVAFATGLQPQAPGIAREPQMNILVGGSKPLTCVIVRDSCTYHPSLASKRGVDIGYKGKFNSRILVENNYFTGGRNAMELKNVADTLVRNNTFWAPGGMVTVSLGSPDEAKTEDAVKAGAREGKVIFEHNTYIDNGKFDLAQLRAATKSGQTDKVVPGANGRPNQVFVFKRVNRYEPERIHLAVYNWPKAASVAFDLADVLKPGQTFRIVEVHNLWGEPALAGVYDGKPVNFKPTGPYAPEFGCYVLSRGQ